MTIPILISQTRRRLANIYLQVSKKEKEVRGKEPKDKKCPCREILAKHFPIYVSKLYFQCSFWLS